MRARDHASGAVAEAVQHVLAQLGRLARGRRCRRRVRSQSIDSASAARATRKNRRARHALGGQGRERAHCCGRPAAAAREHLAHRRLRPGAPLRGSCRGASGRPRRSCPWRRPGRPRPSARPGGRRSTRPAPRDGPVSWSGPLSTSLFALRAPLPHRVEEVRRVLRHVALRRAPSSRVGGVSARSPRRGSRRTGPRRCPSPAARAAPSTAVALVYPKPGSCSGDSRAALFTLAGPAAWRCPWRPSPRRRSSGMLAPSASAGARRAGT